MSEGGFKLGAGLTVLLGVMGTVLAAGIIASASSLTRETARGVAREAAPQAAPGVVHDLRRHESTEMHAGSREAFDETRRALSQLDKRISRQETASSYIVRDVQDTARAVRELARREGITTTRSPVRPIDELVPLDGEEESEE